MEFPDRWRIFALNGVRVPRELAVTPARKLDTRLVLKERNTEVRREIVRKIGMERIAMALGAVTLDAWGI